MKALGSAVGYLTVLSPPALLTLGAFLDKPALAGGTVLLLFPLARMAFGGFHDLKPPEWHPTVRMLLDQLPKLYAFVLAVSLGAVLWNLQVHSLTLGTSSQWVLSLWVVLMLTTCVAHTLLHRRSRWERTLSHVLAGIAGYPILGYEHVRHHRLRGNTTAAEWPRLCDSVWTFGARRLRHLASETLGWRGMVWIGSSGSPSVRSLRIGMTATALAGVAFYSAVGWIGVAIYTFTVFFVACGVQLVTYMQHWGLGDDHIPDARLRELAWEDDCRFEAWLTMSMSVHHSHHADAGQPYYRLVPTTGSPRMPTGYVLLMFATFVPPIWRRTMEPALDFWLANPHATPSAGRGMLCIAAYRGKGLTR